MTEEPENHTIRLLQELRAEMREMREDLIERIGGTNVRIDGINARLDGNTLILNMLAGLVHNHEERISRIDGDAA